MPIAPPNSPLLDLMYTPSQDVGETISREDMMEIQREQEARLLGTFFIQAIFLALSIMLYSAWEWSQFSEPWESALFYGLWPFHYKRLCTLLTEPCLRIQATTAKSSSA